MAKVVKQISIEPEVLDAAERICESTMRSFSNLVAYLIMKERHLCQVKEDFESSGPTTRPA